jgi:hypothetical protein
MPVACSENQVTRTGPSSLCREVRPIFRADGVRIPLMSWRFTESSDGQRDRGEGPGCCGLHEDPTISEASSGGALLRTTPDPPPTNVAPESE